MKNKKISTNETNINRFENKNRSIKEEKKSFCFRK